MSNSASSENSSHRSPWLWFLVVGCLLITLFGLFLTRLKYGPPARSGSADVPRQSSATGARARRTAGDGEIRLSPGHSTSKLAVTAEEIVAGKLVQFARSRRELVHGMALRFEVPVTAEV